ncbi:putative periplasmic lipoprotein [Zestomonas carbonaria]|uniref:Lipoprotein n=1 Tax=Zestomonas carbonaria TaxID=2762745 RepID=A0A7U7EK34_9GAMM|nr:hypothetical protein [Pseudomonas carbonaria]CAD5106487.1 hypothetical protein PSEWESI4_00750 [Pseudomonas carbonaria]
MKQLFALLFCATLLVGCTSKPVLNPSEQVPANVHADQATMQKAIVDALTSRGWTVQQVTPTDIRAAITVRNRHRAQIAINYSPLDYQIQYVNSSGLDYKDGKIHRNYNRWVANLSNTIRQNLTTATNAQ